MSKNDHNLVRSVIRTIDILEKIVFSEDDLGVTEISNSLGLGKSTVHRLLTTLIHKGYVQQDEKTGKYRTGIKLLEVGSVAINNLELRRTVRKYLNEIRNLTNETVHLGILDEFEVVYVDKVETSEHIRMYSRIGRRISPHCVSLGKVLLAYSSEEYIDEFIEKKQLTKYNKNTITDPVELKKHLAMVKKQGYAIDNEEQLEGIRCIAGPIFDYKGEVIAAFSISGPSMRMTEERVKALSRVVLDYSEKISSAFGFIKKGHN